MSEPLGRGAPMDTTDFERLYALYATDVLRVCYYYLGNREKAEDITQDVFVQLITTQPQLQPGKEKAWLLKVALNRCRDLWRSAWARRVLLSSDSPAFEAIPDSNDHLSAIADQEAMLSAINKLPPDFKEVILLFYYQNYSTQEICDMLGLAEGTVSSRMSRARKKLQSILKEVTWDA